MSLNMSQDTYNKVEPYAKMYGVPDLIWETVADVESSGNPRAQNGKAYGLFQLLTPGGEGDEAIKAGYTPQQLLDPGINAKYAMPQIAFAWNKLKTDTEWPNGNWWIKFASWSGHPYENGDITNAYVKQVGLQLKKAMEDISAQQLGAKYEQAYRSTGNIDPFNQALDNVASAALPAVAVALTPIDWLNNVLPGVLVKTGLFIIALLFIIVGFILIAHPVGGTS